MTKRFDYDEGDVIRAIGASYRVIKPLGAGGMGACYLVEDANISRPYVLKTINADIAENPAVCRGLELEARVLGKLHGHDNIVQAYALNYIESSRIPFYLMDPLSGESLGTHLRNARKIDVDHAAGIAIQIASGLHHAHQAQVVHRDVKPDNIILHRTVKGQRVAKLIDFGVFKAKAVEAGFKGSAGTPGYMAPEQLRDEEVTFATDIYALGLVFYEMVAGAHPFKEFGLSLQGAIARIDKMPPTFREIEFPLGTDALDVLDQVLAGCLALDPKKRWNDASTIEVRLAKLKRVLERSGRRSNVHEAVTSPGDVPADVLRQMTGIVDEGALAAPTHPDGVVISPRPGQMAGGFAPTMPEAGKAVTKPERAGPRPFDSRLPTNPPSDPLPAAADDLDYGPEDPDSYGRVKVALAEAEKLAKRPRRKKSGVTSTDGVAGTIVEGRSYSFRIRMMRIFDRIVGSTMGWVVTLGILGLLLVALAWTVWPHPQAAAPVPVISEPSAAPPPIQSISAPSSAPQTNSPAPSISHATSASVRPMGTASGPPQASHAPRPLDVGSGL